MIAHNWFVGEMIDALMGILGLYAKFLNARLNRISFVIWGIAYIYWISRNISNELYAQAVFSFITMGISWYGYFRWKGKGVG